MKTEIWNVIIVRLSHSPRFQDDWCSYTHSSLALFAYTDERSIDVDGGWWWCRAESMDLVPIVGRGFSCASPPTPPQPNHSPWGNSTRGCRGGTGHCAIEGINWCGTFLVHMAKAIKYLPKAFSLPFLNQWQSSKLCLFTYLSPYQCICQTDSAWVCKTAVERRTKSMSASKTKGRWMRGWSFQTDSL